MSGSMLMRLIDVVLIILFGFIGISDIQNKTQLKLPGKATDEPLQEELRENVFVQVVIHQAEREQGEFEILVENEPPVNAANLPSVRTVLRDLDRRFADARRQMIVIIDPTEEVTMQRTVDVFDLCEQENFIKSIDFGLSNGLMQ